MNAAVHGARDFGWDEAVARLARADVYHASAYHRIAEANGEGIAQAFVAQEGDDLLFHPVLRRPIDRVGSEKVGTRWSDLETVYGYSGPLATTTDPLFLARAWSAFDGWCRDEGIVAEFIRFNPLLGNEVLAAEDTAVALDRQTAVLDLPSDPDVLWARYSSVQRNMVRKAQRAGFGTRVTTLPEGLQAFRDLYAETMQRVGADPYYNFGEAYFEALPTLGDAIRLVSVDANGSVVAAALLLVDDQHLHYHLSASRDEGRRFGANNLLLHDAATWGIGRGLRLFHLGGGRTPDPADALLRFKTSVASRRLAFHTGRRVHDAKAYAELCASWQRQAPHRTVPPYFLLYRLPLDESPG
jgi:hypothetical protein